MVNKPQIPKEMLKLLPELRYFHYIYKPLYRVIQTNLVFAVGLPQWISKDKDVLKGSQYFGRFGKVFKVEVNANQTFTGPQVRFGLFRSLLPFYCLLQGHSQVIF